LDAGPAEETVSEIKAIGGEAALVVGDLTLPGVPEQTVQAAVDVFGGLDVIVNTAGYTWDAMIQNMTDRQWEAMLAIHLSVRLRFCERRLTYSREGEVRGGVGRVVMRIGCECVIDSWDPKVIRVGETYSSCKDGVWGCEDVGEGVGSIPCDVNCVAYGALETRLIQAMK
jgi:3-oxoacyl-[acyl-carrier protein] reductase